jgi:hypothetical protein
MLLPYVVSAASKAGMAGKGIVTDFRNLEETEQTKRIERNLIKHLKQSEKRP